MGKYCYEIWYGDVCIDRDKGFDTLDEAKQEAEVTVGWYIKSIRNAKRCDFDVKVGR